MCVFVCLFVYFVWTLRNVLYTHNSIDDNMVWPQVLPIYPNWILVYIRWGDTYGFNWLLHHFGSSMWSFFNTNRLSLSFKTCLCHPKHLYSVVRYLQRTTVSISWNDVSLWAFHISEKIRWSTLKTFLCAHRKPLDVNPVNNRCISTTFDRSKSHGLCVTCMTYSNLWQFPILKYIFHLQ